LFFLAALPAEVLGILGREKSALMVVKPPGELRTRRVLKVDNSVFVPVEQAFFKDLRSLVSHSREQEFGAGIEPILNEPAEKRSRSRSVETVVVVENTYSHAGSSTVGKLSSLTDFVAKHKCG
jgi:hypothetical protein